jgi:hypothetical protein
MLKGMSTCLFVLCLVFLALPSVASAQSGTATGKYKFFLEDGALKSFEFDAKTDERGTTSGFMSFTDEAKVEFFDVDGNGDFPREEPMPFFMKVDFDAMTIEKNRAVLNGVISDSSHRSYIGKFVQFVVEDNDGVEIKDQFNWTICEPFKGGWIPVDAEDPNDKGAFMSWWSTDAERRDDVGIPSPDLLGGNLKSCKVHSLQSYEFASVAKGDGAITIRQ